MEDLKEPVDMRWLVTRPEFDRVVLKDKAFICSLKDKSSCIDDLVFVGKTKGFVIEILEKIKSL